MKISELLRSRGVSIAPSEKTRLLTGLIYLLDAEKNLGTLEYWREAHWIRLFRSAEIRKGRAYEPSVLRQIARPQEHTEEFMMQLAQLVHHRVFRPGFILGCEICGLTYWYSLEEAAGEMQCFGCRQPIAPALEQSLVYQPNPLLCKALKNGIITEILTLLWANRTWEQWDYTANVTLKNQQSSAEIDLVIRTPDQQLYFIEAKDSFNNLAETEAFLAQMEKLYSLAATARAVPMLATLYEKNFPESWKAHFTAHNLRMLRLDDLLS